jgi:hypothetical protein
MLIGFLVTKGLVLSNVPCVLDAMDAMATSAWCRREARVATVSTTVGIPVAKNTTGIGPALVMSRADEPQFMGLL